MFEIAAEDGNARHGILKTRHGKVHTPFFMPVATRACGKFISTSDYKSMGARAIISNAFVLYLKPGVDVIEKIGGIHKFMNYQGTVFTDCGGFQMLRESFLEKPTNKGIHFRSPFDKSKHIMTPKITMEVEMAIGSDVAMALDDVPKAGSSIEYCAESLKRTMRWHEECLKFHTDKKQLLFGIAQGNIFKDLREKSAKFNDSMEFDGNAIGGLAIGESKENMYKAIGYSLPFLSKKKPRYLMGVGSPLDLIKSIGMGIDCFDSVYPTQNARHANLFTSKGWLMLDKSDYKADFNPIDANCECLACKKYTRAYIHHLVKINEPVGKYLMTYHNLHYLQRLMENVRIAIDEGKFVKFEKEFNSIYSVKNNHLV